MPKKLPKKDRGTDRDLLRSVFFVNYPSASSMPS